MDLDASEGFIPPKDYKPRTTAHVIPWLVEQHEKMLGPLLRAVSQRCKQLAN